MSIPKAESFASFAPRDNTDDHNRMEKFTKYLIEYREEIARNLGISTEELHEQGSAPNEQEPVINN